jgi:hypothetical protein
MVSQGAGPGHLMYGGDVGQHLAVGPWIWSWQPAVWWGCRAASTWWAMELVLATYCMVGRWGSINLVGNGACPGHLLYGGDIGQHLPGGPWS